MKAQYRDRFQDVGVMELRHLFQEETLSFVIKLLENCLIFVGENEFPF